MSKKALLVFEYNLPDSAGEAELRALTDTVLVKDEGDRPTDVHILSGIAALKVLSVVAKA